MIVLWSMAIVVVVLSVGRAVLVALGASRHVAEQRPLSRGERAVHCVDLIVPAYNEAVVIAACLHSVAASGHPANVVVVDDGSSDDTATVVATLGLSAVSMIRQANAGKATALNAGIAATSAEIVAMVDADTVLEADTLRWLIEPFDDPNVGAVAGNTKVVNRDTLIGRWQHVEYVAGPNADRRIYDVLRCMPTVPGAVGAFRRQALDDIGGVSNDTLAEDTDLTMAIERAGWRVVYEDRAVAWTEVPADLRSLWRQRRRWTDGTMQAMWKHIRALTEPGAFGRRGLPYMAAYQLLWPLMSLSVDILAIHGLMVGPIFPACDPMIIVTVMQLGVTAYSLRLDRERIPVWQLPLHHFAQRIFMFALLACSLWALASRRPAGWQPTNRIGARQPVRSK